MSTHIFALCQAADLRAMEATFRQKLLLLLCSETRAHFPDMDFDDESMQVLTNRLIVLLNKSTDQDSITRLERVMSDLRSTLLSLFDTFPGPMEVPVKAISAWCLSLAKHAHHIFVTTRETYVTGSPESAVTLLGRTGALYTYIRGELGVKLHWGDPSKDLTVIGTEIGKIFHAWKSPKIVEVLVGVLAGQEGKVA